MKKLLLILSFTLGLTTAAFGQKFDSGTTFGELGAVAVTIMDNATGGCWTNLVEAKSYAKGQLDILGAEVVDDVSQAAVSLEISVLSSRHENLGFCYGSATVRVSRFDKFKGHDTIILFSDVTTTAVSPKNYNLVVLDLIKNAVAEWK